MKILTLVLLIASNLAFASDLQITPKGQVSFLAVGRPSFLKINGKGTSTTGTLKLDQQLLSGVIEFDLTSLQSGIGLRDEHMKTKYLEVGKFPKAQLKIEKLSIPASFIASGTSTIIPFEGLLTLSDFGIDIPKYAGITVANEVKVNAEVHALPMSTKQ